MMHQKVAKKGGKTHEVEALSKLLNAMSLNDWQGFEYAGQHISIEKLTTDIMTAVTKEAKQTGIWKSMKVKGEGGSASSLAVMRARALQIREWKKEEACLRADVDNFILRYNLLHNKAVDMREDMWERKARLEEFFADFHSKKERPLDFEVLAQVGSIQTWSSTVSRSALTTANNERRASGSSGAGSPRLGDASPTAAGTPAAAIAAGAVKAEPSERSPRQPRPPGSQEGGEAARPPQPSSPAGERFPRPPQGAPSLHVRR
ncbi:unnamed protein product, partial [Prorocentrum cordatum]